MKRYYVLKINNIKGLETSIWITNYLSEILCFLGINNENQINKHLDLTYLLSDSYNNRRLFNRYVSKGEIILRDYINDCYKKEKENRNDIHNNWYASRKLIRRTAVIRRCHQNNFPFRVNIPYLTLYVMSKAIELSMQNEILFKAIMERYSQYCLKKNNIEFRKKCLNGTEFDKIYECAKLFLGDYYQLLLNNGNEQVIDFSEHDLSNLNKICHKVNT